MATPAWPTSEAGATQLGQPRPASSRQRPATPDIANTSGLPLLGSLGLGSPGPRASAEGPTDGASGNSEPGRASGPAGPAEQGVEAGGEPGSTQDGGGRAGERRPTLGYGSRPAPSLAAGAPTQWQPEPLRPAPAQTQQRVPEQQAPDQRERPSGPGPVRAEEATGLLPAISAQDAPPTDEESPHPIPFTAPPLDQLPRQSQPRLTPDRAPHTGDLGGGYPMEDDEDEVYQEDAFVAFPPFGQARGRGRMTPVAPRSPEAGPPPLGVPRPGAVEPADADTGDEAPAEAGRGEMRPVEPAGRTDRPVAAPQPPQPLRAPTPAPAEPAEHGTLNVWRVGGPPPVKQTPPAAPAAPGNLGKPVPASPVPAGPSGSAASADRPSSQAGAALSSPQDARAPEPRAPEAGDEVRPAQLAAVPPAPPRPAAQPPAPPAAPAHAEAQEQPVQNGPDVPSGLERSAEGYDEATRAAVHRVMRERRDVRTGFRQDPVPDEVLTRVLAAAHTAPSVGFSQPWDFLVLRSAETRARVHQLAVEQRAAYAASLPTARAKAFKGLKVEAILDTPVNIVVTADPTRGGRHTLGRFSQPQMAPYSSALAVENLWLAARAEGLGVGWVSFFDERELATTLGLPEHLEIVAYLCVGFVDEFPAEPELETAGWAKRRPLSWVVHTESYGQRALPGAAPVSLLGETLSGIGPLDQDVIIQAWEHQAQMTKPAGSLGVLESVAVRLAGLAGQCPPPLPEPAALAVFAADHGVHAQGVTPWPQRVTAQMVGNVLAGGAVINAFATQVGAEVCVVDVGVAADLTPCPGLVPRKLGRGTADFTQGPAMSRDQAAQAVEIGIETARDLVAAGNRCLLTGDMGIANTTACAALVAAFTGADPAQVTGRGTGVDDETHARKIAVVRQALALHQPDPTDPLGVLAAVGGFEQAALTGFLLGAAALRVPVLLDGLIAGAAALAAAAFAPQVVTACVAGHRSVEPGHAVALDHLGLRPLIDLELRLGEGTGAALALPLVQSAVRAMRDVATFADAGVSELDEDEDGAAGEPS
jgi:nicotinate-nucleotide--dimethylbenzimidazole phosphoribosyltransferase